jgi:hypothetical protein
MIVRIIGALSSIESHKAVPQSQPSRRQIVIGERGWVWVADVSRDGGDYLLSNASVIRVWGTANGIGELALKGKTSKTVLDPCGTVRVPELAVIGRIDVASGVTL